MLFKTAELACGCILTGNSSDVQADSCLTLKGEENPKGGASASDVQLNYRLP